MGLCNFVRDTPSLRSLARRGQGQGQILIAPIGLKLRESDPPHGASQKNIWRRRSHGFKVKFQIAPIGFKLGESDPPHGAS